MEVSQKKHWCVLPHSWKESWHYEMFQMQLAATDLCKSYCTLKMRPCDINYSAKIGFEEWRVQYFSWSSFVCSVSNVSHWPIFVIFTSWGKLAAAGKTDQKMGVGRNVGMSSVCGGGSLLNMDDSCMHCASLIHSPSMLYLIGIIKGRWTLSQLWLVVFSRNQQTLIPACLNALCADRCKSWAGLNRCRRSLTRAWESVIPHSPRSSAHRSI